MSTPAAFLRKDWPGHGSAVTVLILLGFDNAPSNVPPLSGDVGSWLRSIFEEGEYERAAIIR